MDATRSPSRIFPALTAAQRLRLDLRGYVLIENVLSRDEVRELHDTILELERAFRATGSVPNGGTTQWSSSPEHFRIDNLPHVADCFLRYLTHPRLVGMAEEALGYEARLVQSDAHVRRPGGDRGAALEHRRNISLHTGRYFDYHCYRDGLYHFPFVKTLTNLTDLGPDDGGTLVVPGSHKHHHFDDEDLAQVVMEDPSLIEQVVAPAGSTLVFFESLMHSGGLIRSDRQRLLIVGGYVPVMFQPWFGSDPDPELLARIPESQRDLLTGARRWQWLPKHRTLGMPVGSAPDLVRPAPPR